MPRRPLLTLALALLLLPLPARAQDGGVPAAAKTVNVELVLDASGSMAEALPDGELRIDAARRVLHGVIDDLPERAGVNVGLRVYGHLGDNTEAGKPVSCRATELLVPVAGTDKAALHARVDAVQPTGWTPIAYALEQAAADFAPGGESIANAIVLVTDGEETCDPPERACAAAAAAREADVAVTTHVVGFALTPEQSGRVACIAEEGGGRLFGADDAGELGGAIGSVLEELDVLPAAAAVPPASAAAPLDRIRSLVYHEVTAWESGVTDGYGGQGEQAPLLSDDGSSVVFARAPGSGDPANPNRIFVMRADGSGEREVDAYPSLCYCGSMLDVSADGGRVVSSDAVQLRAADAAGGGGRELLALDSNEINAVRISGDGATVVFRIYRDTTVRGTDPSEPIERGVYAVDSDGGNLRRLVGPDDVGAAVGLPAEQVGFFGAIWGLDVSADGSRVAFAVFDAPDAAGSTESLFAVDAAGGTPRRLVGPASFLLNGAISGDGATVAYVAQDAATGRQEAGVVGFDGGVGRVLTDSGAAPPGIGTSLPSGERIQLGADGSRLLLGGTGLLFDTASGATFALSVDDRMAVAGDPPPLIVGTLYRASMSGDARRVLYLALDDRGVWQAVVADVDPADPGAAPTVDGASVAPDWVLTEGGSTATVSARVTAAGPVRVGVAVLRDGRPDPNTTAASYGPLADDGTSNGDAAGGDGVYTTDKLATDCCAVPGPRRIRVRAETRTATGLRHATAVDVAPFAVVTEPPAAGPIGAGPVATPIATPAAADAAEVPGAASGWLGVPPAADCTAEAPTVDAIIEAVTAPPAADAAAFPLAIPTEEDLPGGDPVDDATRAAVSATMWEAVACLNAGDFGGFFAFLSPDGLRAFYYGITILLGGTPATPTARQLDDLRTSLADSLAAPPTPVADAERARIDAIRDARELEDGRVLVLVDGALGTDATLFMVFRRVGGGWLIDAFGQIGVFDDPFAAD